jgi:type I restriction enzyme S subunit
MTANWIEAKLGDVCTSSKGKKPKILQDSEFENSVPYLDIQAFEKGNIRQFADKTSSRLCSEGDVLIVWDGARSGLVGKGILGALGSTIASIQSSVTKNQYLLSFLELQYDYINSNAKGTGIPHVNPDLLWDITIPIPPLNEQKRIVKKLEQIIPKAQSCKKRLEKISLILKRFRKSVLSSACSGELTKDWREKNPDIESAEELLKRIGKHLANYKKGKKQKLSENIEIVNQEIPNNWFSCSMQDLFSVETGATPYRKNDTYWNNGSIPWVKTGEVHNNEIYEAEEFITELAVKETNTKLFPINTLLIAMYGEGKTRGQIGRLKIEASTNQACAALVNPDLDMTINRFIFLYCLSQYEQIRQEAEGGNQPNLNLDKIKRWNVILPPLEEQTEIVKRVEALFAIADKIEERYKKAKKQVDKVQLSLLAKAFRGELVPQNPNDKPIALPLSPLSRGNSKKE